MSIRAAEGVFGRPLTPGSAGPQGVAQGRRSTSRIGGSANHEMLASIQGMSARFGSPESTVCGQGRQLNELANALLDLQKSQKQSNEWQAQVTAHMDETEEVIAALKAGRTDPGAAGAGEGDAFQGLRGRLTS